jgi:exodeoxyribonuclease III
LGRNAIRYSLWVYPPSHSRRVFLFSPHLLHHLPSFISLSFKLNEIQFNSLIIPPNASTPLVHVLISTIMHRFFTSTKKTADSGAKEMSGGTGTRQPQKFTSWNCNGFSVRLNKENKQNLNDFIAFLEKEQPDVVTLQEVRMTRAAETRSGVIDPSKRSPKCDRSDADLFADFKRRIPQYSVHLSLAGKKYAGQAIFVHKTLQSPVLSFTFDKSGMKGQHDNEGRIIIAEFDSLVFVSTYTPNNGITEEKFQRRRDWDASSELFLGSQRDSGKVVVYQGDLNVAAEDDDLSGDPAWWRSQCCVDAVDPNDIGQPGCYHFPCLEQYLTT